MHVGVIKFIWLVEGEVVHLMLGDTAIQFSVFIGSGAVVHGEGGTSVEGDAIVGLAGDSGFHSWGWPQ